MKTKAFLLGLLLLMACKKTEISPTSVTLYFPPLSGQTWEKTTPEQLGWNTAQIPQLLAFLEQNQTRAFLVLKDGKIVMEHYFGKNITGTASFDASSYWYWASAGKTLTSFLVGKAQEEKFLKLDDPSLMYLGKNWSSLTATQENQITVKHHLMMTTGLNDQVPDNHCTKPECLRYLANPNTRWAYHNAPYTILDKVIAGATKQNFTEYFESRLAKPIGMDGFWRRVDSDNVYFSTPRSMARFGLLVLNKAKWENQVILADQEYWKAMLNTSQNLNLSYGYLWWLNGKSSTMAPTLQTVFPVSISPKAPADMVAAMGKNGQLLNIVPSQNLIVIRMGDNPDNTQVPFSFQDQVWEKLNLVLKK